jgi:putative ABC transport system permease protein
MFDPDKWNEIYQTLAKNPLRTALTALGVGWGIFMLVAMLGSGNGLQDGVNREFSGRATNSVSLWARSSSMPYQGLPKGRPIRMDMADYHAIRQNIQEVEVICPRNQLGGWRGGSVVTRGLQSNSYNVYGDFPEIREIELFDLLQGRFLNPNDLEEKRKIAVIGKRVLEVLFEKDEDPIGEYIRINGIFFQVVGVFAPKSSGDQANRESQKIYVPFTTFQQAFNAGEEISWFSLSSQPGVRASVVEEKVTELLRQRHRVHPNDRRAFGSWNMEKEFSRVSNLFFGINLLIWIVGTGTLLAGVIGVMNIMLIIVRERTKEIGIRRAIGATPWSITSQIILESVILTTVAGYAGLVVGVGLNELISFIMETFNLNPQMYDKPSIDLNVAVRALGILIFAGAMAGLLPASRAVSIKPVDALRAE